MGDSTAEGGNPAAGQESYSAFFYGTLMAPEVFFTVCFRLSSPPAEVRDKYRFRPAVLPGYCRHRVRHADYPGVVEDATPGREVRGAFVDGLTAENVAKLDYFEGSEYERRTVRVRLLDLGGAEVETQVYVFMYRAHLEDREWDFDEFRRDKLKLWAREDYVFADCDPDQPATVATEAGDEAKQS
ncbi:hypothetical protein RB595_006734 [Gaeumannomyces hyphopodioides]